MEKMPMMGVFDPLSVKIVDKVDRNVIIRGNEPLSEAGGFAYEELMNVTGLNLSKFDLVDVCMIDNVECRPEFRREMASFRGLDADVTFPDTFWPPHLKEGYNPRKIWGYSIVTGSGLHQGGFVWWPIRGMKDGDSPGVYLSWPGWNFSGLVDFLGTAARSQDLPPSAIYFHCMDGSGATGALHTCYLMKHHGLGLSEAESVANASTQMPKPSQEWVNLIKAYAKMIGRAP